MKGSMHFKAFAVLALLVAATPATRAVELADSPIHTAMRAELAASAQQAGPNVDWQRDDEFGSAAAGSGKKSIFKAAVFSALIPGGGQLYMGNKKTASYFLTAEALTWLGYAAFRAYGDWRRDDYVNYAAVHANAQLDGKSDDFIDLVGFYSNIRDYNAYGRAYDPERPYLADTPENHWEWPTREERIAFRTLKNRSRESYRRADFMIGVAIVDRVISIVDAVRSVSRHNRRLGTGLTDTEAERQIKFAVDPLHDTRQVSLTLYTGF